LDAQRRRNPIRLSSDGTGVASSSVAAVVPGGFGLLLITRPALSSG